jgi:hypothetical protein
VRSSSRHMAPSELAFARPRAPASQAASAGRFASANRFNPDAPIRMGDAIPRTCDFHRTPRDHVRCSEMRIGRDFNVTIDSRSDPSLHDVRYHAPAHQADCPVTGAELFVLRTSFQSRCHRRNATTIEPRRSRLVEPDGIEPTTSCLQSRRSPN